jgi:NAD(P)-dependent dehydrogenase (short-subunit alcohol dehydrogenase family)
MKNIVVVGAGRGIGLATVKAIAEAKICLPYRANLPTSWRL